MLEQKVIIQEGGRIVIPAAFRKELRIAAGEEVTLTLENGELRVISKYQALLRLRALVRPNIKKGSGSMVNELITTRRAKARSERAG